MRLGPKTRIRLALARVNAEISGMARSGGRYAGGLASEGYSGGYAAALQDVALLLNGVIPQRRDYWDAEETKPRKPRKKAGVSQELLRALDTLTKPSTARKTPAAPIAEPMCEECDAPMHRYTDPDTHKSGWSCDLCGWSQDD